MTREISVNYTAEKSNITLTNNPEILIDTMSNHITHIPHTPFPWTITHFMFLPLNNYSVFEPSSRCYVAGTSKKAAPQNFQALIRQGNNVFFFFLIL